MQSRLFSLIRRQNPHGELSTHSRLGSTVLSINFEMENKETSLPSITVFRYTCLILPWVPVHSEEQN